MRVTHIRFSTIMQTFHVQSELSYPSFSFSICKLLPSLSVWVSKTFSPVFFRLTLPLPFLPLSFSPMCLYSPSSLSQSEFPLSACVLHDKTTLDRGVAAAGWLMSVCWLFRVGQGWFAQVLEAERVGVQWPFLAAFLLFQGSYWKS